MSRLGGHGSATGETRVVVLSRRHDDAPDNDLANSVVYDVDRGRAG